MFIVLLLIIKVINAQRGAALMVCAKIKTKYFWISKNPVYKYEYFLF